MASTTFEGYGLTEEQKDQFALDFEKHDLDGSGLIDVYELAMFIDAKGHPCPNPDGEVVFEGLCIVDGKQPEPRRVTLELAGEGWDNAGSSDADHTVDDTCNPMDNPVMAITVDLNWMDIRRGAAQSALKLNLVRGG